MKPKAPLYVLPHGIEVIGEYAPRGKVRYWRVRIRPHRFFPGEHALKVGVPARVVFDLMLELWDRSDVRIGHNEAFDARMVRIALLRHRDNDPEAEINARWKAGKAECTQALSTPILKLPPTERMRAAGRNHHKSANLGEAYQFFTGRPLEGAHSAMVDVQACIQVYRAIKSGQREAVAA